MFSEFLKLPIIRYMNKLYTMLVTTAEERQRLINEWDDVNYLICRMEDECSNFPESKKLQDLLDDTRNSRALFRKEIDILGVK